MKPNCYRSFHMPFISQDFYRQLLLLINVFNDISFAVSAFLYNFADEPNKKLGVQHGLCC